MEKIIGLCGATGAIITLTLTMFFGDKWLIGSAISIFVLLFGMYYLDE